MRRIFRTFWSLALGLLLALGLSFLAPTSARASTAANLYGPAMVSDAKAGKTVPILLIDDNDSRTHYARDGFFHHSDRS